MGSRWLKIQDRSFCVEFKNTELKKCGAELLIMWSAGDERQSWWCRVTVHRLVGLFDGPFSGNPTLIGPWGCPMALPCHWGMTDSSNEACHRRARDHSREGSELQWARVTSKEFWFLSSGEGGEKKKTPWETASLVLPLNTRPFTVCQFSVLETHRRDMRSGGWLWWIFHKQRERKNGEGGPQSHEIRCWMLSCKCLCASLQLQNKVLVMYLKKESHVR